LFGRGAADDKAAVIIHALACRALEGLQANVTIVVDGEEEISSPHLQKVLSARQMASPDVVIVPDCPNWSLGVPALTVGLGG
jgi:acetylornithine deacetylase/succinyl-diaminopimelate desuccinylase-like protein